MLSSLLSQLVSIIIHLCITSIRVLYFLFFKFLLLKIKFPLDRNTNLFIHYYVCTHPQVRSATLDTWLPEQVAFIQCKTDVPLVSWLINVYDEDLRLSKYWDYLRLCSMNSPFLCTQRWEMKSQIVTGKQSCHQIMIELALKILFVQSMYPLIFERTFWYDVIYVVKS